MLVWIQLYVITYCVYWSCRSANMYFVIWLEVQKPMPQINIYLSIYLFAMCMSLLHTFLLDLAGGCYINGFVMHLFAGSGLWLLYVFVKHLFGGSGMCWLCMCLCMSRTFLVGLGCGCYMHVFVKHLFAGSQLWCYVCVYVCHTPFCWVSAVVVVAAVVALEPAWGRHLQGTSVPSCLGAPCHLVTVA